ncbi:MAG: hypothetical protein WC856_13595 [Methylococcaceae bacterium]|jgi:hypothetical protein
MGTQVNLTGNELITRKQISAMFDISKFNFTAISNVEACGFPKPVMRRAHNEFNYDKAEIMLYMQQNNLEEMLRLAQSYNQTNARKKRKITPRYSVFDKKSKSIFDNNLAAIFLKRLIQ